MVGYDLTLVRPPGRVGVVMFVRCADFGNSDQQNPTHRNMPSANVQLVLLLAAAASTAAAANDSSCGGKKPSPVKDCDMRDLGSCGNACCAIDVTFLNTDPKTAYVTLKAYLSSGGKDGSYAYINNTDAAGHNPGDDLTPYKIAYDYIFQGEHITTHGFTDTINVNIQKNAAGETQLRFFSISNIHGALGDNGQTYKTIMYLLQTSDLQWAPVGIAHGCGHKKMEDEVRPHTMWKAA